MKNILAHIEDWWYEWHPLILSILWGLGLLGLAYIWKMHHV